MMARALALALVTPACLLAQLQLFLVEGGPERLVSGLVEVGTVEAGDRLEITFRIRNLGLAQVPLQTPKVEGDGFLKIFTSPVPAKLESGATLDFMVRFQPTAAVSYSANLSINNQITVLRGTGLPGATVSVQQGNALSVLSWGGTVDFGTIERDARATRRFLLENRNSVSLSVPVGVTGESFRGPLGLASPVSLKPRDSVVFDVEFAPPGTGPQKGALEVGGRTFQLLGTSLDPPLPKPQIVFQPSTVRSSQQVNLSVRLASVSRTSGSGQVRIDFLPGVPGAANDSAIQFLATGSRAASFTVSPGEDVVRFEGRPEITFQTGTTAGSLVFTVQLGIFTERATLAVAPAPIAISSTRATRSTKSLEVQLTGFDNAHSVSQLAFTFFDQAGAQVEPGRISLDASAEFRRYFDTTEVGGMFTLRAVFPVTGDAAQILAVEVEITSALGTTHSGRVRF